MADVPLITINPPQVTWYESNFQQSSIRTDGHSNTRHAQIYGPSVDSEKDFTRSILGYTVYDSVGNKLNRFPPEPHPRYPWMVARSVDFVRELGEPTAAGPSNSLVYQGVELAVGYEAVPGVNFANDGAKPSTTTSEEWRFTAWREEFDIINQIIPRNKLKFVSDNKQVPEPGVQLVESGTVFATWMQIPVVTVAGIPTLPGILAAKIASVVGRINSVGFGRWQPLTLFCAAPKYELKTQPDGTTVFDITFTLLRRGSEDWSDPSHDAAGVATPNWDRLIRPDGKYYKVVRIDDVTRSVYDRAAFQDLFKLS